MVFVPWEYHIKNNQISESLILPMLFVNQWRLPVLFVISGMGTRFALSHRSGKQFIQERFVRLVIPLIFGILFIISPQIYYERLADGQFSGSFIAFYPHFFDGIYPNGNLSWNHLWFLPYLFVYSLILAPLFIKIRNNPDLKFVKMIEKIIKKPLGLLIFAVPLIVVQYTLGPLFPVTRNLFYDWYAFFYYLILFVYGYLFISIQHSFWPALDRMKFIALICGLVCFPLNLIFNRTEIGPILDNLNLMCWIVAIFGYSARYLNKPSPVLKYANRAVYPFYILHQTITLIIIFYIRDFDWSIGFKFIVLSAITFGGSWLIYELLIRRNKMLGFLFGLKSE